MADTHKKIRKYNKFLTTKLRRKGGRRYMTAPEPTVRGPILLSSITAGIQNTASSWLFYTGGYAMDETTLFIIDTTKNPNDPTDSTIIIPFTLYTPNYPITILWGDGTQLDISSGTQLTTAMLTHTYASAGQYSVRIVSTEKKIPVLNWSTSADTNGNKYKLVQLNTPLIKFDTLCPNSSNISHFADGCTNLNYITTKLFYFNPQVRNYDYCFNGCTSLTTIPDDIFSYAQYQSTYQYCLANNTFTEVPSTLFANANAVDLSCALCNNTNLSNNIDVDVFFGPDSYINVDVHEIFKNCINTTGNATDFVNKFTEYVAFVEGTGTFDTGYGLLSGKIYAQEIYDANDVLVRDLVPAKTGNYFNGKLAPQDCLYDSVDDIFILPSTPYTYGTEVDLDDNRENNLPDSFKRDALYMCELWTNYAVVESIWTSFPPSNYTWLTTEQNNWLLVDDRTLLLTIPNP